MTLEHLLTMSSGLSSATTTMTTRPAMKRRCGTRREEPDFYRYTLKVPMATPPGENAVYCSASPNLALGMVGARPGNFRSTALTG